LVAGCSIPTRNNTKVGNNSSPTIPPSIKATIPVVMHTTILINATGQLNVSIGDYPAELTVFVDNVSAGNVSDNRTLNLTIVPGIHDVRICVIGKCINENVLVLSSNPTTIDFGERLTNEVVKGPLHVSIGGYNAELPVFVDNMSVGNVSNDKALNLMVVEGNHNVKVCVGKLCENETVEIKFAQPVNIDFGERLKKIAEFSTPTIRIVDSHLINGESGTYVTVDVELINPTNTTLTMNTTIQISYSYINPRTHWRTNNFKQTTVTRSVKAGTNEVRSVNIYLSGGYAYNIEIPVLLDMPSNN
jgi:hypothetical protein